MGGFRLDLRGMWRVISPASAASFSVLFTWIYWCDFRASRGSVRYHCV